MPPRHAVQLFSARVESIGNLLRHGALAGLPVGPNERNSAILRRRCNDRPGRRAAPFRANTRDSLPMPLHLTACFCAALILLLLAAAGQSAPPAPGHWQSVLAAGDIAEPVFDN